MSESFDKIRVCGRVQHRSVSSVLNERAQGMILKLIEIRGSISASMLMLLLMVSAAGSLLLAAGCATHSSRFAKSREVYFANDLGGARQGIEELLDDSDSDAQVLHLDLAMVELFDGQPAAAEKRLRAVRDQWEKESRFQLVDEAQSLLTDDRKRAYVGDDYEQLMLRVMLTVCSLLGDGVDADSYSLQTLAAYDNILKQAAESTDENESAEGQPTTFKVPAIAPYLHGVIREASLRNYDDAEKAYSRVLELLPESELALRDLKRAQVGVHNRPGHGVVYVIGFVGRGPSKEQINAPVTSDALLVADRIVSQFGEYSVPPTIAPVKIPSIVRSPKPFDQLGIRIDGEPLAATIPVTDVATLAEEALASRRAQVIARAVARRVLKKGAVYAVKDRLDTQSNIASVALDAAGVIWEAAEQADTRAWGLLPGEIQVQRLELPVGTHLLALEPLAGGEVVGLQKVKMLRVVEGRNTYVLSCWPDLQPIGEMLIGSQ